MPNPNSLYEITDDLQALINTEDMVPPEQMEVFKAELAVAIKREVDKVESTGRFIKQLESNAAFAREEAKRALAWAKLQENAIERLREYVLGILVAMPPDAKGKPAKLTGRTLAFHQRNAPPTVEITDPEKLPLRLKRVTLDMTGEQLFALRIDEFQLRSICVEWYVDKAEVKAALKRGETVPGAEMMLGGTEIVIR